MDVSNLEQSLADGGLETVSYTFSFHGISYISLEYPEVYGSRI